MEVRHEAVLSQDIVTETRAWKIVCLFPVFLLRRPASGGHVSREDLSDRFDKFTQGEWLALYNDAILSDQKVRSRASAPTLAAKGRAACQKVQLGEGVPCAPVLDRCQRRSRQGRGFQSDAGQTAPRGCEGNSGRCVEFPTRDTRGVGSIHLLEESAGPPDGVRHQVQEGTRTNISRL